MAKTEQVSSKDALGVVKQMLATSAATEKKALKALKALAKAEKSLAAAFIAVAELAGVDTDEPPTKKQTRKPRAQAQASAQAQVSLDAQPAASAQVSLDAQPAASAPAQHRPNAAQPAMPRAAKPMPAVTRVSRGNGAATPPAFAPMMPGEDAGE